MENKHHNYNCNDLKHANGSATIVSGRIHSKNGQFPQNDKSWILGPTGRDYDFRIRETGLKRSNHRNSADLSSKNSVLKFHETCPLQHSILNCTTSFFCTDNYFNDKKIFEYNCKKKANQDLWISNEDLDADPSNFQQVTDDDLEIKQEGNDSLKTINTDNGKQKICVDLMDNQEIEKILNDIMKVDRKIEIEGKQNEVFLKSTEQLLMDSILQEKDSCSNRIDLNTIKVDGRKPTEHFQNNCSSSISLKYSTESISNTSLSKHTCPRDSHVNLKGEKNVLQVFCVNCRSEPEFAMPMLFKPSFSETYVSETEPTVSTSSEFIRTCIRTEVENTSKYNYSQPIPDGLCNKKPLMNNSYSPHLDARICQSKNRSNRTQCPKLTNASFYQHLSPSLMNTTSNCHNMEEVSSHENDSTSLSTLSLFFIMKDLNTKNCSYCKLNESYGLLSTAMICLRMNTNSKKKPPLSKSKNERSRSCSDILKIGDDYTKNTARTKAPINSKPPTCPCLSDRTVADEKENPPCVQKDQTNSYKVLGIQTSEHNEKRQPKLNLLLSFHPDGRKKLQVKDHPDEAHRTVYLRSYPKRENCRIDKTAQASVLQKCACIQPSLTNTPSMHQKSNQVCPSKKSTSIQPSSTIFLRESKPTTFTTETRDGGCRAKNYEEAPNIFHSPPACPLFLPYFEDTAGEVSKEMPQNHLMLPISMDLHGEKVSSSLACIDVKEKFRTPLTQKNKCNLKSKPSISIPFDERISGDFSKIQISNPPKNDCLKLSSTRVIHSADPNIKSNTCKDFRTLIGCNGTSDSEEGLNILKLKERSQYSKVSKKRDLLSTFEFRSANDFVPGEENKEDLQLITEDFQSLKRAIEEFMTMDILDTNR